MTERRPRVVYAPRLSTVLSTAIIVVVVTIVFGLPAVVKYFLYGLGLALAIFLWRGRRVARPDPGSDGGE